MDPSSLQAAREAIPFRGIGFYHLRSEKNPADILSKHWGHESAWKLLRCLLFCKGDYGLSMGSRLAHGTIEFMGSC